MPSSTAAGSGAGDDRLPGLVREHRQDAARYGELKLRLAAEHRDDRARYTEAKAEFIEDVLERCRRGRAKARPYGGSERRWSGL